MRLDREHLPHPLGEAPSRERDERALHRRDQLLHAQHSTHPCLVQERQHRAPPGRPDQFPSLGASYHRRLREGAMQRHALTDDEWARIEPLLPKPPRTGRPPKDHRLILDALLWLGKTGAPWRDLRSEEHT